MQNEYIDDRDDADRIGCLGCIDHLCCLDNLCRGSDPTNPLDIE
jgi:hypothetical protein